MRRIAALREEPDADVVVLADGTVLEIRGRADATRVALYASERARLENDPSVDPVPTERLRDDAGRPRTYAYRVWREDQEDSLAYGDGHKTPDAAMIEGLLAAMRFVRKATPDLRVSVADNDGRVVDGQDVKYLDVHGA